MTVKVTVEFYDHNGLALWSGWYRHERSFTAESISAASDIARESLLTYGMLYKEAKTVTLRCDVSDRLFPATVDLPNPHHTRDDSDVWNG